MFHIVLVEPEIPQNTGNISRTCAVTGAVLHLVKPLGFTIDDKQLKRAGLDYWQFLEVHFHENFDELRASYPDARFFYASTHAKHNYCDAQYESGDFLVFGKETAGLPKEMLKANEEHTIRIPMGKEVRSLNLSNAVAIVLYEALRQHEFPGLS